MEEPLALGFHHTGQLGLCHQVGCPLRYTLHRLPGRGNDPPRGATSFLVRSLFMAMALLK